jgi:hypothetical protein
VVDHKNRPDIRKSIGTFIIERTLPVASPRLCLPDKHNFWHGTVKLGLIDKKL